jgi:hypothetical protein
MISPKASQRLYDDHCACSSKNGGEEEVILRQRETTTEGSNHREREQLPQARVRPRRFHFAGGCLL